MTNTTDSVLDAVNRDLPDGYSLRLSDAKTFEHGWMAVEAVCPDGTVRHLTWMAGFSQLFSGLRTAQSELIEHEFGEAWPRCPLHGSHPLKPEPDGWHCPTDGVEVWAYGSIKDDFVEPEPNLIDGVVRWWADDLGWGVVADRDGDVFVHFSMIEGTGYRSLNEGDRVEYRVSAGMQGKFRQAEWARQIAR
jgi:cold shock protein